MILGRPGALDVNVHGVLNVMRHFVPAMVAVGTGLIVNISSGTGHRCELLPMSHHF